MTLADHPAITGATAAEVAGSVRDLITRGALSPGDPLPPIRDLAARLQVNRNTVAAAYRLLVTAGAAQTRGRGGTVVMPLAPLRGEGSASGDAAVDLASGNPDPTLLPSLTRVDLTAYRPPLYGHAPIDEPLLEWATATAGANCPGEHRTILTHGAVDAVERLLATHLTRGDAVAVEDPCFLSSIDTARANGYQPLGVPVDPHGMSPDGLEAALAAGARAVIITPRAHNPTGASVTPERAAALREVIARYPQVLVIEDDHFAALSRVSYARSTPQTSNRWALVRSVSKALGPDLRLAVVLADPSTAQRLESRIGAGATWVSHLLQHLTYALLTDEDVAGLLATARETYSQRARTVVEALVRHGAKPFGDPDGLNVWVQLDHDAHGVVAGLAARGWQVRPGSTYAADRTRPADAIRVTSACVSASQADAFAVDLAAVLDDHRSHRRHRA